MLNGDFSHADLQTVVVPVKTLAQHRKETRAIVDRKIKHAPFSTNFASSLTEENTDNLSNTLLKLNEWKNNLRKPMAFSKSLRPQKTFDLSFAIPEKQKTANVFARLFTKFLEWRATILKSITSKSEQPMLMIQHERTE
jgi:hypothetical protein